jgi:hypothetical protein
MPLRLSVTVKPDLTLVRVDGKLVGPGATQLEQTCRAVRRPLVLDLTHLATADDSGVVALRRLAGEGAHLVGVSPYMGLLLGEAVEGPKSVGGGAQEGSGPSSRPPRKPGPVRRGKHPDGR